MNTGDRTRCASLPEGWGVPQAHREFASGSATELQAQLPGRSAGQRKGRGGGVMTRRPPVTRVSTNAGPPSSNAWPQMHGRHGSALPAGVTGLCFSQPVQPSGGGIAPMRSSRKTTRQGKHVSPRPKEGSDHAAPGSTLSGTLCRYTGPVRYVVNCHERTGFGLRSSVGPDARVGRRLGPGPCLSVRPMPRSPTARWLRSAFFDLPKRAADRDACAVQPVFECLERSGRTRARYR